MISLNIRNAKIGDLDSIINIENQCFLPSEAASPENIKKRINEFPEGFLVAESDQEILGILNCGCVIEEDISEEELKSLIGHDPDGHYMVVFGLAVSPNHRKKGIAFALLDELRSRYNHKKGILLLCKEELIPYYEKYGFINQGKSKSSHGGFSWFQMKYSL